MRCSPRRSRSLLWLMPLVLAAAVACVSSPKKQAAAAGDSKAALTEDQKRELQMLEAEVSVGRNMAGRFLQMFGPVNDEALVEYVNRVGTFAAQYSDFPERRFMFQVLDSDEINAYACPGGYILITRGAVVFAQNEAELAFILSHEIAHVGFKHMMNTLTKMNKKELEKAAEAGKAPKRIYANDKARMRPIPEESETGATLARYMAGSSTTMLSVLQAARAGMSVIFEKGLDKDLEFQADREGEKFAVRAGYDPKAGRAYLDRMMRAKGVDNEILHATHPSFKDRIARLGDVMKELKADEIVGAEGKERFEKATAQVRATTVLKKQ
jgi:predicted Zn-dependent protease